MSGCVLTSRSTSGIMVMTFLRATGCVHTSRAGERRCCPGTRGGRGMGKVGETRGFKDTGVKNNKK